MQSFVAKNFHLALNCMQQKERRARLASQFHSQRNSSSEQEGDVGDCLWLVHGMGCLGSGSCPLLVPNTLPSLEIALGGRTLWQGCSLNTLSGPWGRQDWGEMSEDGPDKRVSIMYSINTYRGLWARCWKQERYHPSRGKEIESLLGHKDLDDRGYKMENKDRPLNRKELWGTSGSCKANFQSQVLLKWYTIFCLLWFYLLWFSLHFFFSPNLRHPTCSIWHLSYQRFSRQSPLSEKHFNVLKKQAWTAYQ